MNKEIERLRKLSAISHKVWLVSTLIFVISRIIALFL